MAPNTDKNAFKLGEKVDWEEYDSRWEGMWGKGLEPGEFFDAEKASPILSELFRTGKLDVTDKTFYVPGCGRGYDCFLAVEHGAKQAVGIDFAPSAVQAAKEWRDKVVSDPALRAKSIFKADNFFEHGSTYDVGYDYTFLCALHPSMREQWAEQWAQNLAPEGTLVTLIFPICDKPDGPPWAVSPQLYRDLLSKDFEEVSLEPVPEEHSHDGRGGRECIALWKRRS